MNNSKQVKLFDADNNLVNSFDNEIDKILTSVHGTDYYDKDEPYVDTRLIPLNEIKKRQKLADDSNIEETVKEIEEEVTEDAPKIKIVKKDDNKTTFKDFIPIIVFVIVFIGVVCGGYYLLNHFDFSKFVNL